MNSRQARLRRLGARSIPSLALFLATLLAASAPCRAMPEMPHAEAPRLVNYYARLDIAGKEDLLSRWDMLILPYKLWDLEPESIAAIKALNPDQLTLAYIDPVLVPEAPTGGPGDLEHDFFEGVDPLWLARDTAGNLVSFWPGTYHVNFTEVCPEVGGVRYRDYFVDFLHSRFYPLIEAGEMDGVFLDEMSNGGWDWWQATCGCLLDYDGNGSADPPDSLRAWLTRSMEMFADSLAAPLPAGAVLVGNNCRPRHGALNGKFYESFPSAPEGTLEGSLMNLDLWSSLAEGLYVTGTNGIWEDEDRRAFRFRYAASLLSDDYFSFDHTTFDHHQLTWYDLFDFPLGLPQGPRYTLGATPVAVALFEGDEYSGVAYTWLADLILSSDPAHVIQGDQSLLIDVFATDEWPGIVEFLVPGGPQGGETYTFSFRYRTIATELEESEIFLKAHTSVGDDTCKVSSSRAFLVPGSSGLFRGTISLCEGLSDYHIYLRSHRQITLAIDSLTVVEGAGGLWAREYENGIVVVNNTDSTVTQTLPYNPGWFLVDADSQLVHYPGWLDEEDIQVKSIDGLVFSFQPVSAPDEPPPAARLELSAPWPSPGNPGFSVRLAARKESPAVVSLHDVSGRRLGVLWRGTLPAGGLTLDFDSGTDVLRDLASGVYLIRAETGGSAATRKWVLLR